jgi:hypothetical protein
MIYRVDARFTDTSGKGIGRWRMYYDAADLDDALWASRSLVPKCQVRVRRGREVVVAPCLAQDLPQPSWAIR